MDQGNEAFRQDTVGPSGYDPGSLEEEYAADAALGHKMGYDRQNGAAC